MATVLLIVPTAGGITEQTSKAVADIAAKPGIDFVPVRGRPADYARNCAIRLFIDNPRYSHLLFVDSDVEPPANCVEKLLTVNRPIAVGCYAVLMPQTGMVWALSRKQADGRHRLLARRDSPTEPFEVDGGGAGCLMLRRDVFSRIDWPWFRWVEHDDGSQTSEDIYFFNKAAEAGYTITAVPDVVCGHYNFNQVDVTKLLLSRSR